MNIELLNRIKQHILEDPRRLDMGDWFHKASGADAPPYGTVACIAGWACFLSKQEPDSRCVKVATKLLGLEEDQANRLFFSGDWLDCFLCDPENSDRTTAELTAARIDHFIATGGGE